MSTAATPKASTKYILPVSSTNVHGTTVEMAAARTAPYPSGDADYERDVHIWTKTSSSSVISGQPYTLTKTSSALSSVPVPRTPAGALLPAVAAPRTVLSVAAEAAVRTIR